MSEHRDFRVGDIVRRNRRVARIQRLTADKIHISILKDFTFRVIEHEILPRVDGEVMLMKVVQGHYSSLLFNDPDAAEKTRDSEPAALMRLILEEHASAFGKREFKQVLVDDDGLVPPNKWNSWWTCAYKAMRECGGFKVDEKGRYCIE